MSRTPRENDTHTLQNGSNILWYFVIFMEIEPFPYYLVITKRVGVTRNGNRSDSTNIYMGSSTKALCTNDIHNL